MMRRSWLEDSLVERLAGRCAQALHGTGRIIETEIVPRVGFHGMLAVTLPAAALIQELMPGWRLPGGVAPPLLSCVVLYFVLRFPALRALEATIAGSLVSWLAYRGSFSSSGGVLFVSLAIVAVIGHWLYTEFWPAHAAASAILVVAAPVGAWIIGARPPIRGLVGLLSTLLVAPLLSVIFFVTLEWLRRHLEVSIEPDEDGNEPRRSDMVHQPYPVSDPTF